MGKFPIADKEFLEYWICKKCKTRNKAGAEKCRKCGYKHLRVRRREVVKK
jgi:large subunit ribosomal protein L40e